MQSELTEATLKQKKIIKRLRLEKLVPLNVPPIDVDKKVISLQLNGNISGEVMVDYWASSARSCGCYVPTLISTIKNNLYSFFKN